MMQKGKRYTWENIDTGLKLDVTVLQDIDCDSWMMRCRINEMMPSNKRRHHYYRFTSGSEMYLWAGTDKQNTFSHMKITEIIEPNDILKGLL